MRRFKGIHMIDASNVTSIESGLADIGLNIGLENADSKATLQCHLHNDVG